MNVSLQNRERKILIFLIILVSCYAVFYAAEYVLVSWRDMEDRIARAETLLHSTRQAWRESQQSAAGHQASEDVYRQQEPDESVRTKMMQVLQAFSSQGNVRIVDIKPQPVREHNFYKEFPIGLTLEGDFADIMHFFYRAENASPKFQIREFRFSPLRQASQSLRCQMTISRLMLK